MRGCTCHGPTLCDWCATLAARAGVGATPVRLGGDLLSAGQVQGVTEKVFMAAVVRLAREHGWYAYHTHDARKSVPGYPDLTLVHPDRAVAIFAECKVDGAQLTLQQVAWLKALATVRETTALLWRPEDWPDIRMRLT